MKLIKLSVDDRPPSLPGYIIVDTGHYKRNGWENYGASNITKYYYVSKYHTAELQLFNKQSLSITYKVLETGDKKTLNFVNRGNTSPSTLFIGLYVEHYSHTYAYHFAINQLGDSRLIGNNFYVWVGISFTDTLGSQYFGTAPYHFSTYDLDDRRVAEVSERYYKAPCFVVKNLPVTAEFLFDYEDTLLPLKEECPVGTSKLLTNNYPGYICVDYQPIENSIKNIRNIIKQL